jgi:hypothetical protein
MFPSADALSLSRVNTRSPRLSSSARSLRNSRVRFSAFCNLTRSASSRYEFFFDSDPHDVSGRAIGGKLVRSLTCLECLDGLLQRRHLSELSLCLLQTALKVLDRALVGIRLFLPVLKFCTRTSVM